MMTSIFVKFQVEGFHAYPAAPDEVAFLRNEHRHMFHFKVAVEVFHDDRELEFILFKRWCLAQYKDTELKNKSCEMIAKELIDNIHSVYGTRNVTIEVSEDDENGAIVVW